MPATKNPPQLTQKTLWEIANLIGGDVIGDQSTLIQGACGIQEAESGDITFLAHARFLPLLQKSRASAVIVGPDIDWREKPVIRVANPSVAFLKVIEIWNGRKVLFGKGVDPHAQVSPKAQLGREMTIGPGVVIGEGTVIGDRTAVLANAFIGEHCLLGQEVVIYPNATIREGTRIDDRVIIHSGVVIGSDGFGYEMVGSRHLKIPQLGRVWIQEDVEIGANSCIDRARFGMTLIKKGTKIDNLVQIAHNVVIGENCLIVSQAGIAGSTELEDNVTLAGQVGVVGHIKIGSGSMIGAQSGVFTSVPPNSILLGSPPRPIREEKELMVYVSRLPELFKEVRQLKEKMKHAD